MDFVNNFLSNPFVGITGYILSGIAACISIWQVIRRKKTEKELLVLEVKIQNLTEENHTLNSIVNNIENKNAITQGEKSQYFQDNSGSVNIDNRG